MDSGLKQRLIGAAVLVALAVIFLPMLVQGPAPDSGVSDVPLSMPDAPRGDYETRDLPLVTPGNAPDGGAVGMDSSRPAPTDGEALPTVDTAGAGASASQAAPLSDNGGGAETEALPAQPAAASAMFPATTAGGDYAVSFGAYSTAAAADAVVGSLRASQLPGYRQAATINGKPTQRVRIGPYATRAEAEAARLRAAHVRDDVGARVVVLDAEVAMPAPAAPAVAATTPAPATAKPVETPKPAATPASTGFVVQLAAFSKPADATALRDKVHAAGFSAFTESVSTDKGTLTRVRVGPVASRAEAEQLKAQVKARLGVDGIVRPHP
ncbi:MAG: SPOR domain-containing protein [Luteimonas sp.]